jgi:5-methylcytosine-specific restriction endonuclease McrA
MRHVLYLETPAQTSETCTLTREHLVTRHLWDAYRQYVVVLMRQRSAKTEKIYRTKRRNLVRSLLSERPVCQRCNADRSQDIHEKKSRARGGSITDVENLVALCRPCHAWVTEHPKEAHEQGWLLWSWE